ATVSSISSLKSLGSLGLVQASPGSKQFYPALPSSVPSIGASDVWDNLEKNDQTIDGTGTRVAVIDTGAAWLHPSLWRASSDELSLIPSGPDYYVDLDEDLIADSDEGPINTVQGQTGAVIDYYEDYMFIDVDDNGVFEYAEGDRWIGGIDANDDGDISLNTEKVVLLGESKIAVFYDQYTGNVYVRGVNLTSASNVGDTNGHGTHVSSTIAGGQPGMTAYLGVAPGADLIIIRSTLDSAAVLDGIAFAVENDAAVINMSFSSYLGFLDGTDIEDIAISEAMLGNGVISTLAAGNLGGRPKHARFESPTGGNGSAILSVNNPPDYSFLSLLWRSSDNDEHIILSPPSGEDIDLGAFGEILGTPQLLENDNLTAYVFPDVSIKGLNRLVIQISEENHEWDRGSWTITVNNPNGERVWIDGYAWDNTWGGTAMRFTSSVDNTRTISSPGTADLGVTVASYNEVTMDLSASSSVGPRVDGVVKPNVAAPGDSIRAAFNSVNSLWVSRSGTSMAAPHAAGVVALIRQAAGEVDGWSTLSALYQGAGGPNGHYSPASTRWGFGLCDPQWSVQHFLNPVFGPIYWDGIPSTNVDLENTSLDAGLDILNVKTYLAQNNTWIQVGMRGETNFNTDDELIINWDRDASMATGEAGVDMRIILTSGTANIYEWSGSTFELSGEASWSNESSAVFLSVEKELSDPHGRFVVSTSNLTYSELDTTSTIVLTNLWSPIISSLDITSQSTTFTLSATITDKDTETSHLETSLSIIDGGLNVLQYDAQDGEVSIGITYDTDDYQTTDIVSLLISVSDGDVDLALPPMMLSGGVALILSFVETSLDQSIVRVGPLISERITGRIVIEGHLLAEEIRLSFQGIVGLEYNLTLNGVEGVYEFDISPSGMAADTYNVYAIAIAKVGGELSEFVDSLMIVQDYSIVILIGGVGLGVLVIIYLGPKILARSKSEE
ncbi:MAG: S8 family serine peptidase, partial [Candidatus Thorarchaeota archaeon]|nr:S8 family serine peptidase [Candidatus Thorarchaeota archaeon]